MAISNRDAQFQGFAKLVMSKLLTYFGDFEDMEQILAHWAYDLVEHTINHAPLTEYECRAEDIPDMTELPKEQEKNPLLDRPLNPNLQMQIERR